MEYPGLLELKMEIRYSLEDMYTVYSLLLFLYLLIFLPIWLIRMKLVRREPLHLLERFGFFHYPVQEGTTKTVWLHAVSVGEVLSLQNLTRQIKHQHPDWRVCVSSLTHSGWRLAREKLSSADFIFCIPLDFRWILRRVFSALRPTVFVLVESELWPNLIREAGRHTGGILLINGRMSRTSAQRYRRIKSIVTKVLEPIQSFQVQTTRDLRHLELIGIDSGRIQVCGNLKAEVELPEFAPADISRKKTELGITETTKIVLAGSTHKGEDEPLLHAFSEARLQTPDLRFILAPRHLDRVEDIVKLGRALSLQTQRRSTVQPGDIWDVLILDTLGELARMYALADAAFIGGSLIPWGGQNLLEPAFYGKPIFFGPHMDNFSQLADIFIQAEAARRLESGPELKAMFLMADMAAMHRMGKNARETLTSLKGATDRALQAIRLLMPV
jgi:3-deoxy-D-manno-octulosonic-acid transferase